MTPFSSLRARAKQLSFVLGIAAFGWAAVLFAVGHGIDVSIVGHLVFTTNEPRRPLIAGVLLLLIFRLLGGDLSGTIRRLFAAVERLGDGRFWPSNAVLVGVMALYVGAVGVVNGAKVAGGADSYGYLSQAELWLQGDLVVEQPFVGGMPWPNRAWSFSPLGYRPQEGAPDGTLVPGYSIGLPLLLAGAKRIGGHDAMFLVVPLLGMLLIVSTYGIGRAVASPFAGLAGAWLLATSPAIIFWVVATMTDIPVAAFITAGVWAMLGRSGWRAMGAGLLFGAAVVIRPNLVFLAAIAGLHYVIRGIERDRRRQAVRDAVLFASGVAPFVAAVAIVNAHLFGSPLVSGYGRLTDSLAAAHFLPNLELYLSWMVESQTVLSLIGLAAVFLPSRALWAGARERHVLVLIALMVASLWAFYCLYLVFEAWWYVRFLLASWPPIVLGIGTVAALAARTFEPWGRRVAVVVLLGAGVAQYHTFHTEEAFNLWEGERRYIRAASLVRSLTDQNSVVLAMQHSGSLRYYGGRMTMRYDNVPREWIDRAVEWLTARGCRVVFAGESWERDKFLETFAGTRAADALGQSPLAIYLDPGEFYVFDVSSPPGPDHIPRRLTGVDPSVWTDPPVPAPRLSILDDRR
ncbi:MAG: glycosyltransferase family 39 protein [Acidobacteria bacterium]|nr:glycosyltransferase family 39 protein [Acidobacteriota bacterium]